MRFVTPVRFESEGWGESTAAIVVMGLVLAVTGIVRTLETPTSQPVVAFELFVSLLVPTGLATGGYWLANRNVSSDLRWRAVTRVSIGIVVACGLAAWLTGYVALEGGAIRDPLSLTTTLAAVGGATGFVTAVREPLRVDSPDSLVSSVPARAAETESPATAESADAAARSTTAGADASPEPTMERPTAAAATAATAALESTTTETPATDAAGESDASRTTGAAAAPDASKTAGTATPAETGTEPAIWNDTGPRGRTAAPARPVQPHERTERDDPVHDGFDDPDSRGSLDSPDSSDSLESPIPARDPGVDAVADVPSTAETVLGVLQRERSRLALAVLYHEWDGETRSVDALARAVSYHTDDSADAVAAGLKHATLPRLDEIRAVDWDPYADRVAAADHAVFEEGVREASVLLESFEPGTR